MPTAMVSSAKRLPDVAVYVNVQLIAVATTANTFSSCLRSFVVNFLGRPQFVCFRAILMLLKYRVRIVMASEFGRNTRRYWRL
jgi:hypothetical protein